MAYNYLEEDNLADTLHDSEEYMRGFYQHIPELQRLTRGKPGKVPEGKPRVTDGTLASIRRETPKQIIQQLPSGRVSIHGYPDMEDYANAVLTDIILPNANSGGIPYAKAKRAIKNTIDVGSAWAECFVNRTGSIIHADYRIKYYRDVLFEQGKVSEFDTNFMMVVDWLTKADILSIIWQEKQRKLTKSEYDLNNLQEMLTKGPAGKDEQNKTPSERLAQQNEGYFKIVTFYQRGVGATFYKYSPVINKVIWSHTSKDPRGVIPIHGLVPEDDDDNPLGEPLAAISAGKQNLLDFDMQMYQYGQGMQYSPPVKMWGQTPKSRIRLAPDEIIVMKGTKATDDFEPIQLANQAVANFANNYGLIKSQILNETGRQNDSSISSTSGNPGFSKTAQGVQQQAARTSISDNDLLVMYEQWQGRVWETCLNIHFAESKGAKAVQLESDTLKRLKLDKQPTIDYDKEYGKIGYCVNASTSKKLSDAEQVQNMSLLDPLMTPQNIWYLAQIGWKLDPGEFQMAKLKRMNIDSIDQVLTKMDEEEAVQAKQQPFPIIDPPQIRINTADLSPEQIAATLGNAGVQAQPGADQHIDLVDIINDPTTPASVRAQIQQRAGLQPDLATQQQLQAASQQADAPTVQPDKQKTLGESVAWKPGDLKPTERAQALAQVGIQADTSPDLTDNQAQAASDTAIKQDKHVHDTALALAGHAQSAIEPSPETESSQEDSQQPGEPAETPQQETREPTQEQLQEISEVDGPLSPEEEQVVQELLAQGLTEEEVEEHIKQLRLQNVQPVGAN